ncbi:MAG: hypothetical protein PHS53_01610 [Candidatus Pacebacteria bacterium]|nr:hypothetical protein [Candidatus Paceibacterota bacterium]MDD5356826.1 hypothetical protein [Candidatus Paceibacterota bacterium]
MHTEDIKKVIEELLSLMALPIDRIEVGGLEKEPKFLISTKDARLLIGKNGETFSAFAHIVRKIVEKKIPLEGKIPFSLDVNGYQDQKVREMYAKIQVLVDRARTLQTGVELSPMPAYERMMVHEALANISDITTESTGEGKERRVVIKYVKAK